MIVKYPFICVTKATDTLRICNTYYFSTARTVARTRLNITLYVHCLLWLLFPRLLRVWRSSPIEPLSSFVRRGVIRSLATFVRNRAGTIFWQGISRVMLFYDWSGSRDHKDSCIVLTRRRLVSVSDEYLNLESSGQQLFGTSFVLAGWSRTRHADLTDQGVKCSRLLLMSGFIIMHSAVCTLAAAS
jgi:hypothetical protein